MPTTTQPTAIAVRLAPAAAAAVVPEPGVLVQPDPTVSPDTETTESQPLEGLSPEALQSELKRVRREAAAYRTKLRQSEDAKAAEERAKLGDAERLEKEVGDLKKSLEEAQAKAQKYLLDNAITTAAQKAGFRDPSDALRFVEPGTLEVQEDGTIEGLDRAIQAVVKAKPYLLRDKPAPSVGTTNPQGAPAKPTDAQFRQELFGGSQGSFWSGAGVVNHSDSK